MGLFVAALLVVMPLVGLMLWLFFLRGQVTSSIHRAA
jgi:hypothetical protein